MEEFLGVLGNCGETALRSASATWRVLKVDPEVAPSNADQVVFVDAQRPESTSQCPCLGAFTGECDGKEVDPALF